MGEKEEGKGGEKGGEERDGKKGQGKGGKGARVWGKGLSQIVCSTLGGIDANADDSTYVAQTTAARLLADRTRACRTWQETEKTDGFRGMHHCAAYSLSRSRSDTRTHARRHTHIRPHTTITMYQPL